MRSFAHRSRTKQMGYALDDFQGKPVIAIINTWSDLATCHSHFRTRADEVKRGVWQAGGFPVELPAMSVSETYMKPSPMMYRNFLAMETEELLRSQPIDGVVLMGGCDKTTPGLLMGAISMNLPAIYFPAGPMLRGNWNGKVLGSGSDVWKYWAEKKAGNISDCEWSEMEDGIARSPGHCMTMGTASTMTALAETLGLTLSGASSIPAVDANHSRMASHCGRRIVEMVWEDLKPRDILTEASFENAITADMAIGGSTNAIIHLVALAGRAGIKLDLKKFDEISQRTPMIANLRPSGEYLMEDFYYAGGLRALLKQLGSLLHLDCQTVTGQSLGSSIDNAQVTNQQVIRSVDNPVSASGGTAILYGNLAPDGAVIKPTAAESRLLQHRGPAVVFKDYNDLAARIDNDELAVDENSVLVLQNAGPLGGPGMPEWGMALHSRSSASGPHPGPLPEGEGEEARVGGMSDDGGMGVAAGGIATTAKLDLVSAQQPRPVDPGAPTTSTVEDRTRRMKWWHEAKFGMFIHWGLYSTLGRHEWVMENEGIPTKEYEPYADKFKPKPNAARDWARLAHRAGMKYMAKENYVKGVVVL